MTIDEAIERERQQAKEQRKEMQCKTCKLFARSDLHPLQGYCRKNEFHSIEIDSWRKVCSEYVPTEMCKCAEEHEQLAEWLEELKDYRDKNKMVVRVDVENMDSVKDKIDKLSKYAEIKYNKAIDDFAILIKETLNHDCATTKISEQIIYNRLFDKCNEIAEQLRECKVDESTD